MLELRPGRGPSRDAEVARIQKMLSEVDRAIDEGSAVEVMQQKKIRFQQELGRLQQGTESLPRDQPHVSNAGVVHVGTTSTSANSLERGAAGNFGVDATRASPNIEEDNKQLQSELSALQQQSEAAKQEAARRP
jgi:hypothetical protein